MSLTRTSAPSRSSSPRWGTPRQLARPTRGGLDRQVADLIGWRFFPWQSHVSDVAGEYDPLTKVPCYRTVGVSVSRQNGKTTLVCSRIARQLIPSRQTVAYTAQDRGLARTKWEEHVELLMSTPFAERVDHVDRTNHREMLVMLNGSRYMPVTPSTKKAGRSLSIDLAVVDEAHAHEDMGVVSAIGPAMSAKAFAQIWLLSNAGDFRSGLWRHYTDIGRLEVGNPASSMAWFEYAAEQGRHELDPFDRQAWAEANPSLGLPGRGARTGAQRRGAQYGPRHVLPRAPQRVDGREQLHRHRRRDVGCMSQRRGHARRRMSPSGSTSRPSAIAGRWWWPGASKWPGASW